MVLRFVSEEVPQGRDGGKLMGARQGAWPEPRGLFL